MLFAGEASVERVKANTECEKERQTSDDAVERVCELASTSVPGGSDDHASLSVERRQLTTFTTITTRHAQLSPRDRATLRLSS